MLKNFRLGTKLLLALVATILGVAAVLTVVNMRTLDRVIDQAEQHELEGHLKAIFDEIDQQSRTAEALSRLVASLPIVQDQFASGDRAALLAQLQPAFKSLFDANFIEQFQFHTPPALSFLRLHRPEKFGDDLSQFRRTVVAANESKVVQRGLEGGVAGLGIRGVSPVYAHGQHVGSVELGMTFSQAFFDSVKARRNIDVALHLINDDKVVTFASTLGGGPLFDALALSNISAGGPQLMHTVVDGVPRAVFASSITDFSGTKIGVLELSMDRSQYVSLQSQARDNALTVAAGALTIAILLAIFATRSVTHRIQGVAEGVRQVALGDLTVDIPADGGDEVGQLGRAALEMRMQLHALAQEVHFHADAVHKAANEIATATEGQAATSSQLTASVSEISTTMEEISASSNQIAEHSVSVVENAHKTWIESKQGAEAMETLMSRMVTIQTDNSHSLTEILELGNRSKEISKVMVIINEIADQTKLIAFNAALEAASAGDAGRRFSVVASEIRRLADSVTESTAEIEGKINQIQDSIKRLILTSEQGAKGIAAGMKDTQTGTNLLGQIVDVASQSSSSAEQISLSTRQQQTANSQVVVAMREIVTASNATVLSMTRISEISRDMNSMSARLHEVIGRFKLK